MDWFFSEAFTVPLESEGLNGESPEADSDHFYHQLIENIHIPLMRVCLHEPPWILAEQRGIGVPLQHWRLHTWERVATHEGVAIIIFGGFNFISILLLFEIGLCLFVEEVIVVIFGDEAFDFSIPAVVELKEGE